MTTIGTLVGTPVGNAAKRINSVKRLTVEQETV
jgi:hypothetical protein